MRERRLPDVGSGQSECEARLVTVVSLFSVQSLLLIGGYQVEVEGVFLVPQVKISGSFIPFVKRS